MADNEIRRIARAHRISICHAKSDAQFEEKLNDFLSLILVTLASSHEIVRKKGKITHLLPVIKNITMKPCNRKTLLFQKIFELFQNSRAELADLETKEVMDSLYSLYECCRLLSRQKELLCQSQSLKSKTMSYLCKSKLAANIFPAMLHVSLDCLYSKL
ncbi:14056_t:CDS:2 [Dentiscutata heterogama]|uniref:14056_t:CDS:1 n=1 Tax=Dentiscutata heterogama TaxID=1316150 RepID=A0ACA9K4H0_9GLOM|nr:14056_t:CDS:2 [Dentiscutata heterogama]